jgi:hypothetical protein
VEVVQADEDVCIAVTESQVDIEGGGDSSLEISPTVVKVQSQCMRVTLLGISSALIVSLAHRD